MYSARMIVKKISLTLISFMLMRATSSLASSTAGKEQTPRAEARQIFFKGHSSTSVIIVEAEQDDQQKEYGVDLKHDDPNVILSTASALYPSSSSSSSPPSSSSPFIQWLDDHKSSNPFILGTEKKKIKQISKDTFRCTQPSISWFGHHLVPVFVNQISRRSSSLSSSPVMARMADKSSNYAGRRREQDVDNHDYDYEYVIRVQLKESSTDFGPQSEKKQGKTILFMKQLMEGTKFGAVNIIRCRRRGDIFSKNDADEAGGSSDRKRVWEVSSDVALEMSIPLPNSRLLHLPPGFNAIGSRIIRRTCRKRSEEALHALKDEFLNWSSNRKGLAAVEE